MERKELLQLYYNEALEFVFNAKSINRQMINKINKRFQNENFKLNICFNKNNKDKISSLMVLDLLHHNTKEFWTNINSLGDYEEVYFSSYTGTDIIVLNEIDKISHKNKSYILKMSCGKYNKKEIKYEELNDYIFQEIRFFIEWNTRQLFSNNINIKSFDDLKTLDNFTYSSTKKYPFIIENKEEGILIKLERVNKVVDYQKEWKEENNE